MPVLRTKVIVYALASWDNSNQEIAIGIIITIIAVALDQLRNRRQTSARLCRGDTGGRFRVFSGFAR